MSDIIITSHIVLQSAVNAAGTFAIAYPDNETQASMSARSYDTINLLSSGGRTYTGMTASFSSGSITLANGSGFTLPAGMYYVEFANPVEADDATDGRPLARYATDSSGNVSGLVGPDGSVLIRPVTAYTWALKPAAADNTGITIRISDVGGSAGSLWISDGAYWKPVGGRVTLGGSGEGVTGALDTVENSFASFVLPGYAMGPNGCLNIVTTWSYTNSANNKVLRIRFGTMGGERLVDSTQSTTASLRMWTEWQNRNRVDQQAGGTAQSNSLLAGGIGGAAFTSTQDTTVNNTIFITGQKATGAESLILMRWIAELIVP
jgi:hypothetical protein